MKQEQPVFHEWFHKFLINFAMWVFPLLGIIEGIRYIIFADENGVGIKVVIFILSALLILASLFCIKVRYDLAEFRRIAVKELLIACLIAGAAIFLINWLMYEDGAIEDMSRGWSGLIPALWGIAVYRYYNARPQIFKD